MSEVSERYGAVAGRFTARLDGVAPEQWSAPTPCSEWAVRDLVAHVIATHRRVLASLDDAEAAEVDPGDDLPALWRQSTADVSAAVADPERASRVVGGIFGEQPFESLVGRLLCADTLVHTWDLARATGQDERLDPAAITRAMEFLAPIDEAIRRPGGFGPRLEAGPDADEQARYLAFCGRAV